MRKFYFLISYLTFLLLIDLSVVAQTIPQPERILRPVRPSPEPLPEVETLPPVEELISPLEARSGESQTPELDIPGTIVVSQFEVIGSSVFSESELTSLLKPYTNRPISFSELIQAQEAIINFS